VGWHVREVPVPGPDHQERFGRRLAAHRAKLGWTQQELADRLAVSRVAVSHLEAGMTMPGERTLALLAGLFKIAPHDLVAATDYPLAKADRLPVVVTQYTEVELRLALFENDVVWFESVSPRQAELVLERWQRAFAVLHDDSYDRRERSALTDAMRRVRSLLSEQRAR
jgi:transcriptional regulator with XRE-family HTH domain